jgi:gamma-glutamylputrescine oxidase
MVMQLSYWEKKTYFTDVDFCIIGSGIVGLNAALYLRKKFPQHKILVLERGFLPYGASTRNAGFACFGSVSELLHDLKHHSEEEVFNLVAKRWNGLKRLRVNLGDENIAYEEYGGYEIFTEEQKELYQQCIDAVASLNKRLKDIAGVDEVYSTTDGRIKQFGFENVSHIIWNRAEGQIDTGKMMQALLEKVRSMGIEVLNGLNVERFTEGATHAEIILSKGVSIKTKKLLIATDGLARQLLPELNVAPARAQVLITSPIENLPFKGTFHYDEGYYYFRDIDGRVLLGGGRNLDFKGEETTTFGLTEQIQNRLEQMLKEVILPGKKFSVDMRWSGIMGTGEKKTTIIKKLSPHVYCAVRLGGMGIAIGSLIGEEAAEIMSVD